MREADRRKDEFLALLSHELRNPLAPILTAAQLMQLRGDVATPREREVILRQAQHLVRLVDDLLDVSRVARGKVTLAKKPLELASVVAKAVEATAPLLEQRRHQLQLSVPSKGLLDRGGRGAPHAGGQQPAHERRALHAARRPRRGDGGARGRRRRAPRSRQRRRASTPILLPQHVRDVRAGRARSRSRRRGARARAVAGANAHRAARRHGQRAQRGLGRGSEFTVRLPAAAPRSPCVHGAAARRGRAVAARRVQARSRRRRQPRRRGDDRPAPRGARATRCRSPYDPSQALSSGG